MASRQLTTSLKKSKMASRNRISPEEASFRSTNFPDVSSVLTYQLSCTKCDIVIKPRMVTEGNVHPVLEVLLCKKCRYFYDQKQSLNQNLCKWCANDRTLYGCSACSAKFCEGCINRHFRLARTIFKEIEERKWKCCVCFPKPIWSQRAVCAAAKNYADSSNDALKERIAKCNAVRKPASLPVSAHNQSASFGVVHVTQSQTVNSVSMNTGQQQRPSVPSSALVSQARNLDLEWIGIDDSARAVSNEVNSVELYENVSKKCVICLVSAPTMALYPCGHKCLCNPCSTRLSLREKVCPLCRKEFRDIIRVYE